MATRNANSCIFGVHGKDFKIMGLHGAGQAQAYYDATGFWIAPAGHDAYGGGTTANSEGVVGAAAGLVGAPVLTVNRQFSIANSGKGVAAGAGATTLFTYSLPAGSLSRNGQALRIRCVGSCASVGSKTIAIVIGGTTFTFISAVAITAALWEMDVTVIRTGASTQLINAILRLGELTVATAITGITSPIVQLAPATAAFTETAAIVITVQGTGASDVFANDFKVDLEQA